MILDCSLDAEETLIIKSRSNVSLKHILDHQYDPTIYSEEKHKKLIPREELDRILKKIEKKRSQLTYSERLHFLVAFIVTPFILFFVLLTAIFQRKLLAAAILFLFLDSVVLVHLNKRMKKSGRQFDREIETFLIGENCDTYYARGVELKYQSHRAKARVKCLLTHGRRKSWVTISSSNTSCLSAKEVKLAWDF
eukprot:CAMPEP_0114988990 /NCGR_PEP_ID=MMETSP0216-20121206/9929_1 /TAXON_ID=223996 /ORGANISM="Protocruzia adherens, Strain Boccale" /LENGTH=193 /DNA_ID=CAMNT_0002351879 /DNA_START=115 /DNA_END=696 /DNA_ORIENTATION=-